MLIQTVISCSTLGQEYCELIGLYWKLMRRQLWTLAPPPPTLTCPIKFCTYEIFGFIIRWTTAGASFENRSGLRGILFSCCCVCIRSVRTPGTGSICSLQQIRNIIIKKDCKNKYKTNPPNSKHWKQWKFSLSEFLQKTLQPAHYFDIGYLCKQL